MVGYGHLKCRQHLTFGSRALPRNKYAEKGGRPLKLSLFTHSGVVSNNKTFSSVNEPGHVMLCQVIHSGVKPKAKRDNNLHNNPRLPHQLTLGIDRYIDSVEKTLMHPKQWFGISAIIQ